jgi:hypothetical protein
MPLLRFVALLLVTPLLAASRQPGAPAPEAPHLSGRLQALSNDPEGGASLVVNGRKVHAPAGVVWEFPGQRFTLHEVMSQAPAACVERGESGLLAGDACVKSRRPGFDGTKVVVTLADATGAAVTTAAAVTVPGGHDFASGGITFVNAAEGYLRVGGAYGVDAGGTLVRLNDPTGVQSIQTGTGCGREGNCSPDSRFRIGVTPATVAFTTGRPACIPGPDQQFCPPATASAPDGLPVALQKGDHIAAKGALELVDGVGVFFAERLVVQASRLIGPDPGRQPHVSRGTVAASLRFVTAYRPVSECAACTGFDSAEPRWRRYTVPITMAASDRNSLCQF